MGEPGEVIHKRTPRKKQPEGTLPKTDHAIKLIDDHSIKLTRNCNHRGKCREACKTKQIHVRFEGRDSETMKTRSVSSSMTVEEFLELFTAFIEIIDEQKFEGENT